MAICYETPDSRQATLSASSTNSRKYKILQAYSEADATGALASVVAPTLGTLVLGDIAVNEISTFGGIWEGTASYITPERKEEEDNEEEELGDRIVNVEIAAGTTHITQSLKTIGRYGIAGADVPDLQGAIGATRDGIAGVDIVTPVVTWSEEHILPTALINFDYVNMVADMVGTTNNAFFRGYEPGEVLFMGSNITKKDNGRTRKPTMPVGFKFSRSKNLKDIKIGAITAPTRSPRKIDKKGWEYLWVYYEESLDPVIGAKVKKPTRAYVEQVYRESDFSRFGIGTRK